MTNNRNPEGSKRRILEEAEKLFAKEGPYQASVNVIAENAQINKRMIYHYFGSKEELYRAVLKENLQKIYELEARAFEKQDNLIANVRQGIKEFYYFLKDNHNYVKLIAWENIMGGDVARELVQENLMVGYNELQNIYHRGVAQGIFRKGLDVDQIVLSISSLCFTTFARKSILEAIWESDMEKKLEERLEHICELILASIKTKNFTE